MSRLAGRVSVICLGLVVLWSAVQAQQPELVMVARIIDGDGNSRGRTGARAKRPPVPSRGLSGMHGSFFYDNNNVRDGNGRIISGLGVQAWQEGDGARVVVYTLVPGPGAPNVYLATRATQHLMRPERLVEFLLEVGEQRELVELRRFGLKPWTIKVLKEPR